ncbi:MAG: 3'(2'),5'-bisphosphate nucleotidase CysQ [Chloroflexi bacterium HGW-Chloroflexi-1]|nr:MAG: 3'(2'),5'-bisphosphate nucleotidase CysQ [Chloroflexi bacterium HGW-Chloroflexi-1]
MDRGLTNNEYGKSITVTISQHLPAPAGPSSEYSRELRIAMELAREAGAIIKAFYDVPHTVIWKDAALTPSYGNEVEPVTEADRAANAYLVKQLTQAFPDDGVLAEESKDDLSRLEKRRVWIVDPLDGTAEFISHNGEFCIMVGLATDGEPVVGVVYQPIDDVLYAAARGAGAFVEEYGERRPLRVSKETDLARFRLVVSRSHRAPLVDAIIARMGVQRERSIGSVGLKIGLIARGQADFYVHPNPGTKEWDTCAPEVIVREAGGIMTDCWNRPLRYNQRDVSRRFGVLTSNETHHQALSELVAEVLDDAGVEPEFGF